MTRWPDDLDDLPIRERIRVKTAPAARELEDSAPVVRRPSPMVNPAPVVHPAVMFLIGFVGLALVWLLLRPTPGALPTTTTTGPAPAVEQPAPAPEAPAAEQPAPAAPEAPAAVQGLIEPIDCAAPADEAERAACQAPAVQAAPPPARAWSAPAPAAPAPAAASDLVPIPPTAAPVVPTPIRDEMNQCTIIPFVSGDCADQAPANYVEVRP